MKTNRQQLLDLPKELKAFINQQIQDFAPFCLPDSGVSVFVEKEVDTNEREQFFVTIELTGDGAQVKSTGEGEDIYAATTAAKQTLLEHLYNIQQKIIEEMDEPEQSFGEWNPEKKFVH